MMVTVGFPLIGGKNWTGGYHYLLNLLGALGAASPGEVRTLLFVGADVPEEELARFTDITNCECVRSPALNARRRAASSANAFLTGRDGPACRLFERHGVDVVFEPSMYYGWRLRQPVLAWIPDLQHRELPHLTPTAAWWKRELGYRAQLLSGRIVMLSSADSLARFAKYYPRHREQARVIRFAVPPPTVDEGQAEKVRHKYGLPEHFFFMPNQYWAHKNHRLVVEALGILRRRGVETVVFASGRQVDPRQPDHVDSVKAAVAAAGVGDLFLMPGMIPRDDLNALMYGCTALLNASLFEGWSTSVEEARSLGTAMLLSDLEVHREQAGADAIYFDRHSPLSLADAIAGFPTLTTEQKAARRTTSREAANARVQQFAGNFASLVRELAAKASSS